MSNRHTRGFSLIELLAVITIIVLLVGILIPVLGGVRVSARVAVSESMMRDIATATQSFKTDNDGRMPGLFTVEEMGRDSNGGTGGAGLSAMENIMLELAGEQFVQGRADEVTPDSSFDDILVGISGRPEEQYVVRPGLFGAGDAYFTVDRKYVEPQASDGTSQVAQFSASSTLSNTALEGEFQMPDIVDAFGNPLLAWVRDPTARATVRLSGDEPMRQVTAEGSEAAPAWFYWNSNAAFLRANAVGKRAFDHTVSFGGGGPIVASSVVGSGNMTGEAHLDTLAAILGNPGFPEFDRGSWDKVAGPPLDQIFPGAARGELVLHSTGPDGYFVGSKDDGFLRFSPDSQRLYFGNSFKANDASSSRHQGDNGSNTTIDLAGELDDLFVSGGN